MKTAGYLIAVAAEFSARMEHRKYDLQGRLSGFFLNIHRNAASVILYRDRIVLFDGHLYAGAEAGQCLVNGVIHNFIDEMVKAADRCTADIHTGSFANRFQSFQDLNLIRTIIRRALHQLLLTLQIFIFVFFNCHGRLLL